MKCIKCNYMLPDDSEFCQYCGSRIEKPVQTPVVEANPVAEKFDAETEREASAWKTVTVLSHIEEPKVYTGPVSYDATVTQTDRKRKKVKKVKKKYCIDCGSPIDSKTKECTGCGKKYFRGFRFTKYSVAVIILVLVIAAVSTQCVWQYINTQQMYSTNQQTIMNLENKISDLETQVKNRQATIIRLNSKIANLEDEKWDNWKKVCFYDKYVEIVPDDGTYTYHKWGCSKMDYDSGFWIFNTEAADDDYYECSYCH